MKIRVLHKDNTTADSSFRFLGPIKATPKVGHKGGTAVFLQLVDVEGNIAIVDTTIEEFSELLSEMRDKLGKHNKTGETFGRPQTLSSGESHREIKRSLGYARVGKL